MPRKSAAKTTRKETEKTRREKAEKSKPKKLSQEQHEKKVLELADKGLSAEKIGEELRQQGIHPGEYGKKISKILKEQGKYASPDLKNIGAKLDRIKEHYGRSKQDKQAMRDHARIFAQLRKSKKYFNIE